MARLLACQWFVQLPAIKAVQALHLERRGPNTNDGRKELLCALAGWTVHGQPFSAQDFNLKLESGA
jgi:hypothetical protein